MIWGVFKMKLFVFVYWLLIFQYLLVYVGGTGWGIFDKILVGAWIILITPYLKYTRRSAFVLLFILFLIGFLGNLLFEYVKIPAIVNDFFLFLKFPVSLYFGYLYGQKKNDLDFEVKYIRKRTPLLAISLFLLCVINQVYEIFPSLGGSYQIGPFRCLQLFFGHPTFMAATLVFYISLYIATLKRQKLDTIILLLLIFSVFNTTRMKALATILVVGYLLFKYLKNRELVIGRIEFVFGIIVLLFISMEKLLFYFVDSANYARGLVFFNSLDIAKNHFPLGAGIGSFASSGSVKYLSPLYADYDMFNEDEFYANDSFWATIFSQFGIAGFVIFLLLLYMLVKEVLKLKKLPQLFMSASVILTYLYICSIAEVSFVAVYAVPMAFWLGLLLGYKDVIVSRIAK